LLGEFIDKIYTPWRRDNHKAAQATLNMLKSQFGDLFYSRPIDELKISEFYAWRSSRLEQGKKATTVNKNIVALKAALKWDVKQGYVESNPLEKIELLKEYDSEAKVRYLSDDERQRLITALDNREKRIRAGRTNHNEWLDERERPLMLELDGEFADHIKPMVLLSLHTGMRQGNLFALKWGDIDFESRTATLRAAVTKTGKTVRIPLNSFSIKLLNDWRAQCANATPDALIFPPPVSGAIPPT
jgi:integrase